MNQRKILRFFSKEDGFEYSPRILLNDLTSLGLGVAILAICLFMYRLDNEVMYAIAAVAIGTPVLIGGIINIALGIQQTLKTRNETP
jgi:uncharacterized membrane protein YqgA involved in biofilm formation